jgi:membrane associated rhomboid family serine protease
MIEDYFLAMYGDGPGRLFFWIFIFVSMYASASISFFRHKDNEYYRSLGFSGVVSAVLFAFIMLAPSTTLSLMFLPIPIPAWLFGLVYLGFEIYSDRNRKTNIAHDAHIAGAVFGIVFILITNIDQVIANFNALVS